MNVVASRRSLYLADHREHIGRMVVCAEPQAATCRCSPAHSASVLLWPREGKGKLPRLLTLQAARGVAANLVLIAHLYSAGFNWTAGSVLPTFSFYGVAGVDLFFVLSGFIMVAIAGRNVTAFQFLYRRAARIYPTYWLVSSFVLCSMAAHAVVHSSGLELPPSIWRSFLLIPQQGFPLLTVGWTLVFEAYFYLVFTIFLAWRIPIGVGLMIWAVIICTLRLGAADQFANSPIFHVVTNPLTVEFMIGAIIGKLWQRRLLPGHFIVGAIGVTSAALSIGFFAPALSLATNPQLDAWRVVLFGIPPGLILYALAGSELHKSRVRLPSLLVKLGDWSYATYLIHPLVILVIGKGLFLLAAEGGIGPRIVLVVTGITAANLAGAVVYACFEQPTLKWLHKLGVAGSAVKPRIVSLSSLIGQAPASPKAALNKNLKTPLFNGKEGSNE